MIHRLIVIPCGRRKAWESGMRRERMPAASAYTGTPFKVNKKYAESFGCDWLILSAGYGFLSPHDLIEDYDKTFLDLSTNPVSDAVLLDQARCRKLGSYSLVTGLGGKCYRDKLGLVFTELGVSVEYPFAGLPIGKQQRAVKWATRGKGFLP